MAGCETFDEFYEGTCRSLLRQLTAMTLDRELAAEAVQEAYVKAWQRWKHVGQLDDPSGWVRTVAWHHAVSQYRRRLVGARLLPLVSRREAVPPPQPEDRLDLEDALRQLRPEQRRALVLHEYVGLSVQEIADETGVAEGTVKSRLSRGRDALAAILGRGYPSGPVGPSAEVTP